MTEECVLPSFTHCLFGRRTRKPVEDGTSRLFTVIEESNTEHTEMAMRETRERLREMGSVIVLMFTPEQYKHTKWGKMWGATNTRHQWGWSHRFRPADYTSIDPAYIQKDGHDYCIPEITMNYQFHEFFIEDCGPLCSIRTYVYENLAGRKNILSQVLHLPHQARLLPLHPSDVSSIPALDWRGNAYFLPEMADCGYGIIYVIHAIPMSWIVIMVSRSYVENTTGGSRASFLNLRSWGRLGVWCLKDIWMEECKCMSLRVQDSVSSLVGFWDMVER